MATHSSVLAWRIPGTREPGGLPSMGSHRVGHDWSDIAAAEIRFYRYISVLMLNCNWWFWKILSFWRWFWADKVSRMCKLLVELLMKSTNLRFSKLWRKNVPVLLKHPFCSLFIRFRAETIDLIVKNHHPPPIKLEWLFKYVWWNLFFKYHSILKLNNI